MTRSEGSIRFLKVSNRNKIWLNNKIKYKRNLTKFCYKIKFLF